MMALLSLAVASFGIGMTEFMAMGLLPDIARELLRPLWTSDHDQAIAHAGWFVSLYALGVVVGAPTLTALGARHERHRVLLLLAVWLTAANAAVLIAPTFEWAVFTRFLAGLPHGAFFGMAALIAADLLGPAKRAQGVAFALLGLTIANVVGVPVGTWVGQTWGWQAAFLIVAAIFLLATVMIAVFVPSHPADPTRTFRAQLGVFRIGQVWATLAMGAIGFGGFFALYSYIAPLATQVTGLDAAAVPAVLIVMGLGMTVGNLVGGRLADWNLSRTLLGGFAALIASLAGLGLTAQWAPALFVFVFLSGASSSVLGPAIQTRLMDVAGDNQSIAAAMNHSALNIGNSLGAMLGGLVIAAGWGFLAPTWVGVVLGAVGVTIGALAVAAARRSRTSPAPSLAPQP